MMVVFDRYSHYLHQADGLVAEVHIPVLRGHPVVCLVGVYPGGRGKAIAHALGGCHSVRGVVRPGRVFYILKGVVLKFDQELCVVCYALFFEEFSRLFHDVPGILIKYIPVGRYYIAEHVEHPVIAPDLEKGGGHVGDRHHVRVADLGVSVVRGVKTYAFLHYFLTDIGVRQRDASDISQYVHHQ